MSDSGWSILFFGLVVAIGVVYALIRAALGAKDPPDFPPHLPTGPMDL